ncbi:RNA-binding domain-containing protein, partial [Ramicandelaber brevisporus]
MADSSSKSTLWMGELDNWMDDVYIRQIWQTLGFEVQAKVIRNKQTGIHSGFAFVDFITPEAASLALSHYNGQKIPGTVKDFRLNWSNSTGSEYSVFVGDLGPEVTDFMLQRLFQARYRSVKAAKVVTDPVTRASRGYGFVRFFSEIDQQMAMNEMNGVILGSRAIRVSMATPKQRSGRLNRMEPSVTRCALHCTRSPSPEVVHPCQPCRQTRDPYNTTIFVGGLIGPISETDLRVVFAQYGDVVYCKIPVGKGCGFVTFASRVHAETALQQLNGFIIGNSRLRLSWGR